jgi:hypothetical protein
MSQQKIGKVWNFSRTWQVVYFLPLSLLLLERLWFQFETIGASSSYFNLETTAATRKQKNPRSSGTVELPTLTQLTTSASDWISCPANTEMIMNTNGESDSSSNENIPMVRLSLNSLSRFSNTNIFLLIPKTGNPPDS